MTLRRVSLVLLTALAALGACGDGAGGTASHGVFENLRVRHESASRGGALYDSPAEAMPQVRYVIDGGEPVSIADAYVVGELVSVEAGKSFRWTEDAESETRHEVEFNAEDAEVSTVHVTMTITRSIVDPNQRREVHHELTPGSSVSFGIALNAPVNLDVVRAEFESTPTLVALLYKPSPVFDYDEGLWAVLEDGAFLGQAQDDTAYFPALDHAEGPDEHAHGPGASRFPFSDLEAPQRGGPRAVDTEAEGSSG